MPFHIPDLGNPLLLQFANIWHQRRMVNDVGIPNKSMIRLSDLGRLAANLLFQELDESGNLIISLSGTAIDDMMLANLSNTHHGAFMTDEAYRGVRFFHRAVMTHPCGGFAHDRYTHKEGFVIDYKSVALPLENTTPGHVGKDITMTVMETKDYRGSVAGIFNQIGSRELITASFFDVGFGVPPMP